MVKSELEMMSGDDVECVQGILDHSQPFREEGNSKASLKNNPKFNLIQERTEITNGSVWCNQVFHRPFKQVVGFIININPVCDSYLCQ